MYGCSEVKSDYVWDSAISNDKEREQAVWKGSGGEKALENGLNTKNPWEKGQKPGAVRNKWAGNRQSAVGLRFQWQKVRVRSLVEGQAGVCRRVEAAPEESP